MRVYVTPLAPNPRRVSWFMAEKAINDIEVVTLNLMEGQQREPEFVAKAGLPMVPMLELDDGTCLTESLAICRYLEALYPEPNMFGRNPQEVAVIEMWTRRAEMMVATPMMVAVRHTNAAMAALEQQNPAVGEHSLAGALKALKLLDRRLADGDWLAAGRITIADIVAFVGLDFGRMIRFRVPEDLTHVNRWADAMRARPAALSGMPARLVA